MLTCEEATRLISDSFEGKLSFWRWVSLRTHLLLCRFCSRYRRQLMVIDRATRQMAAAERSEPSEQETGSGPTLSAEARNRIRQMIRQEWH